MEFVFGLVIGGVAGVLGVSLLAHYYPLMFVDPKKYFEKMHRKVERKLDKLEEGAKKEVKEALYDLARAITKIDIFG